jgi:predicted MFS family arabinose efflux permease
MYRDQALPGSPVALDRTQSVQVTSAPALRRVMAVAGAAMVVETMLYSAMAPLLPYYKHSFGLSKAQAGILAGSYAVGTLVASLPAAALATRITVKRTLGVGLALLSASSVVVGLARQPLLLDVARFAQGAAGGVIWAASLAWVSGLAPAQRRGAVLGSLTGIAIAGTLLGPPLGALAVATSPAAVFSVLPVISFVLFVLVLRLPSHRVEPSTPVWKLVHSPSRGSAALALWLIFAPSMTLGTLAVLGPLRLSRLGAGAAVVAATFVIAAAAEALVNPVAGHLADRRGLKAVFVVALPIAAALVVLVTLPHQIGALALSLIAAVGILGAFWPPAALLLSASTTKAGISDAYAFALYNVAWAAGQSVGAGGGGGLAQLSSDAVPCILLGIVLLGTVPLVHRARGDKVL